MAAAMSVAAERIRPLAARFLNRVDMWLLRPWRRGLLPCVSPIWAPKRSSAIEVGEQGKNRFDRTQAYRGFPSLDDSIHDFMPPSGRHSKTQPELPWS